MIDYEARTQKRVEEAVLENAEKVRQETRQETKEEDAREERKRRLQTAKDMINEEHEEYGEPFSVCIDRAVRIFKFDEATRQSLYKDYSVKES